MYLHKIKPQGNDRRKMIPGLADLAASAFSRDSCFPDTGSASKQPTDIQNRVQILA